MFDTHQVKKGSAVRLKPGKDKAIRNRHHWIFSGAIASIPEFEAGSILPVHSDDGTFLGSAYFNRKSSIIGRMVSFGAEDPREAIENNIKKAAALRQFLFSGSDTNAYRLINGEGDALPGLVVDKYADALVMQLSTLGMDKLRPYLVDILLKLFRLPFLYEKSVASSRKEEGLSEFTKFHLGSNTNDVEIRENGLRFLVSLEEGQKTGFFLDHREMRQRVRTLTKGRKVLNCFSYTGGFSVYAAEGGAALVNSVDISETAMQYAAKNMALNGFFGSQYRFVTADVFQFLRENTEEYDFVILDPPAFAKRLKDKVQACRGYKDINRIAMQKMPPKSLLLTSSCSYYVDEVLFQQVIFQAAREANRSAKIIGRHQLAADHPINLYHPEGNYLKSLLLYLE
jgi:23S rRNA (cytosine1962-C5)-methyltransferase